MNDITRAAFYFIGAAIVALFGAFAAVKLVWTILDAAYHVFAFGIERFIVIK